MACACRELLTVKKTGNILIYVKELFPFYAIFVQHHRQDNGTEPASFYKSCDAQSKESFCFPSKETNDPASSSSRSGVVVALIDAGVGFDTFPDFPVSRPFFPFFATSIIKNEALTKEERLESPN